MKSNSANRTIVFEGHSRERRMALVVVLIALVGTILVTLVKV